MRIENVRLAHWPTEEVAEPAEEPIAEEPSWYSDAVMLALWMGLTALCAFAAPLAYTVWWAI